MKDATTDGDVLQIKRDFHAQIARHFRPAADLHGLVDTLYAPAAVLHGSYPLEPLTSRDAIREGFWEPLLASFPDAERRIDVMIADVWDGGVWVASMGYFAGVFARDFHGIRATARPAWLRWGAFEKVVDGQIVESRTILDLPALMIQVGQWPLAHSLGAEIIVPGPATRDGVTLDRRNADEAVETTQRLMAMFDGLRAYDGKTLASMKMRDHWSPEFHWYGPGGIGTMRGHDDYERGHQGPFLKAFPDRVGGNHYARLADNSYYASSGWPSVHATHTGGGWLGFPATGQPISMRVMDFWRRDGAWLEENWVLIDIVELALQMGVDILDRRKHAFG